MREEYIELEISQVFQLIILRAAFGKYGVDLWRKANGQGTEYLTIKRTRKSISRETTFGNDVTSEDEIKNTLFYLTGKVAQSLRKKGWEASTIDIKLRYTDFQTLTRAKTIKPTDDDEIIFNIAWDLMKKAHNTKSWCKIDWCRCYKFLYFK